MSIPNGTKDLCVWFHIDVLQENDSLDNLRFLLI